MQKKLVLATIVSDNYINFMYKINCNHKIIYLTFFFNPVKHV